MTWNKISVILVSPHRILSGFGANDLQVECIYSSRQPPIEPCLHFAALHLHEPETAGGDAHTVAGRWSWTIKIRPLTKCRFRFLLCRGWYFSKISLDVLCFSPAVLLSYDLSTCRKHHITILHKVIKQSSEAKTTNCTVFTLESS